VNLPIALTLFRIVLVPPIMVFLISSSRVNVLIAAVIFIAASITDWLDGRMARRWNQVTRLGTLLDPVADKLLVAVALVMLLRDDPRSVMGVLVAVIIGREITISALREWLAELGQRARVAVGMLGKLKTVFQMTAIGLMLWQTPLGPIPIYQIGYMLLFLASALTIWSMISYLRAAWPVMRDDLKS
jgi:CDP-diacylglycerol--glycerol-3-phosphate 3-phosphatidyltransferase